MASPTNHTIMRLYTRMIILLHLPIYQPQYSNLHDSRTSNGMLAVKSQDKIFFQSGKSTYNGC